MMGNNPGTMGSIFEKLRIQTSEVSMGPSECDEERRSESIEPLPISEAGTQETSETIEIPSTQLAATPRPRKKGRPKVLSDIPRKATQVFFTEEERALAAKIGDGSMADGLRTALLYYCEVKQISLEEVEETTVSSL